MWHHDIQHKDIQHNDTQHNDIQHNNKKIATLSIDSRHKGTFDMLSVFYAECHYAQCRYAECRGARLSVLLRLSKETTTDIIIT